MKRRVSSPDARLGRSWFRAVKERVASRQRVLLGVVVGVVVGGGAAFAGTQAFSDVPAGRYYSEPVAWAAENGITTGVGDGKFAPDGAVTRGQNVTFAWRYDQYVVQPALDELRDTIATTPGPAGPQGEPGLLTSLDDLEGMPCGEPGTLTEGTLSVSMEFWTTTQSDVTIRCVRNTVASVVILYVGSSYTLDGCCDPVAQDFSVTVDGGSVTCGPAADYEGEGPLTDDQVYCRLDVTPGASVSLDANFGTEATSFTARSAGLGTVAGPDPSLCDVALTATNCTFTAPDPADEGYFIIDFD